MKKNVLMLIITSVLFISSSFGYYGANTNVNIGGGSGYNGGPSYSSYVPSGTYPNPVTDYNSLKTAIDAVNDSTYDDPIIFINGDIEFVIPTSAVTGSIFTIKKPCTIASNRGQTSSTLGAKIEVQSASNKNYTLFDIQSDNVKISGLRLVAPDTSVNYGVLPYETGKTRGILCRQPGLEVDNCEISGWVISGIALVDNAKNAQIHHNFFHHNRHWDQGYSVSLAGFGDFAGLVGVTDTISAVIYNNIFDYGRHAIAGSGRCIESYEAHDNIIKPNFYSFPFDMHGGGDRKDGTNIAGNDIYIHHNTVLSRQFPPISEELDINSSLKTGVSIRGIPETQCKVQNNWFAGANIDGSIHQRIFDSLSYTEIYSSYSDYNGTIGSIPFDSFTINSNKYRITNVVCLSKDGGGTTDTDNQINIYKYDELMHKEYSNAGTKWDNMVTGDFNHDGVDDIAVYRKTSDCFTIYEASNKYDGTNQIKTTLMTGSPDFDFMDVIDKDKDGFKDEILFCTTDGDIEIWDINSKIFNCSILIYNLQIDNISVSDFNKDGLDEILIYDKNRNYLNFLNLNGTSFSSKSNFTTDYDLMEAIDANNDNYRNEIVFFKNGGKKVDIIYSLNISSGNASFDTWEAISSSDYDFQNIVIGDFIDNDNKDDIGLYRQHDGRITIYYKDLLSTTYYDSSNSHSIHTNITNFDFISPLNWFQDIKTPSLLEKHKEVPTKVINKCYTFELIDNYPNPFNPVTNIKYSIADNCHTELSVYNLKGQLVAELVNETKTPGTYVVNWNASKYASGIYYYKLKAGNFESIKKCILLK